MEVLQRLTRARLEALRRVATLGTSPRGVPLQVLARSLRMTPPSALGHLTVLEELGLVERYRGKTRITPKGSDAIREYVRHHRVAEALFAQAGLSADDSCRAAREVDLALSHTMVAKVCASERHPEVCPHGDPIDPCTGAHSAPVRRALDRAS